ncbi:hydroxyethylthiazole kinase [Gardnerella sp. DNF00172]
MTIDNAAEANNSSQKTYASTTESVATATKVDTLFSVRARRRMFLNDVRQCIERVRAQQPLTHCITNVIVQDITANALLAAGASPIMVTDPEEAHALAQIASGVLINVGTFHQPETSEYMRAAVEGCEKADTPWVLDPVGIGVPALAPRTRFIHEIIKHHPTVIRANASEIMALAGKESNGKGVDSHDSVNDALQAARELAKKYGSVVAISGEKDAIYGHGCLARVTGGHKAMTKVVGTGCALGAIVAAYVGANPERPLAATVAAHVHAAAAGTWAARQTTAPGTFRTLWMDALSTLSVNDMFSLTNIEFTVEPVDWTLYLVTDPRMGNRPEEEVAVESVEGGVTVVQLRDKYSDDAEISAKAKKLRHALIDSGHGDVPVFIDDHVDCAAQLGFNLHVGQKDTPFVEARKAMPAEWMVGLSCARPDLMEKAYLECKENDVPLPDVIGIGAAFETHTKAHDVPPLGVEGVNEVAKVAHSMGVKTLAIGGIHENTVFPIRDLELDGVCTVSALMCAEDAGKVARELKSVITK